MAGVQLPMLNAMESKAPASQAQMPKAPEAAPVVDAKGTDAKRVEERVCSPCDIRNALGVFCCCLAVSTCCSAGAPITQPAVHGCAAYIASPLVKRAAKAGYVITRALVKRAAKASCYIAQASCSAAVKGCSSIVSCCKKK